MGTEKYRKRQAQLDALQAATDLIERVTDSIEISQVYVNGDGTVVAFNIDDFALAQAAARAWGHSGGPSTVMSNYAHWGFSVSDADRSVRVTIMSKPPKETRIEALRAELAALEAA